jgi:hypothetical protein
MLILIMVSWLEPIINWVDAILAFFLSIGKELLANSVGALIGAVLAIPTGLWLDRRIKLREQRERSVMVIRAVYDELDKNLNTLEEFLAKSPGEDEIIYPTLTSNAWQAAQSLEVLSSSGDYELHKILIGAYERINFVTHISQSLWNLFFSMSLDFNNLDRKVKILTRVLRDEAENTLPLIQEVQEALQKRLTR